MLPSPILAGHRTNVWSLVLAADAQNVNIKTALETLFGTMVSAVAATVTINAGVKITSATPATAALNTGTGWPIGSTLKIVNNGHVFGAGGVGVGYNDAGYPGGDALRLGVNVSVDNTNGEIFGGGGGGGRSGTYEYRLGWTDSWWYYWHEGDPLNDPPAHAGGAGGGGQGSDGGGGGTGDTGGGASNGAAGTASGGGAGAAGVNNGGLLGGTGGNWGSAGGRGLDDGTSEDSWDHSEAGSGKHWRVAGRSRGGAGTAPGRAVATGGYSITWLGGYSAARVKGLVAW